VTKKSQAMNGARPAAVRAQSGAATRHDHLKITNQGGQLSIKDARGVEVPGIIACDVAMRPGIPPLMRINLAAGNFEVEGLPVFQMIDPSSNRFRPIAFVRFTDGGPDFVPAPAPPAPPSAPPIPAVTEQPTAETPTTSHANVTEQHSASPASDGDGSRAD
jgi:hypothetical protein